MPDPKACEAKGLVKGTPEYEKCVNYEGEYANSAVGSSKGIKKGKQRSTVGRLKSGGY